MSTSSTSGPMTIARMRPVPPAEDFAALKTEVLTWLPKWCEGIWSDFNAHDPGIMILEQLLYGLTELPYRANRPIGELLKRDETGQIPWNADSLYAPTEILPMAPLTADDYARLLYDRIPQIRYAGISRLAPDQNTIAPDVKGRLQALLVIDEKVVERYTVLADARAFLDRQANLGERFETVQELGALHFALQAEVQLAPGILEATAGASLYDAVVAALEPTVRFHTLAEAMMDEPIDVALTGPRLEAGVIEDADLPRLLTWAEAQMRASQALLSVPGVRAVTGIQLVVSPPATDPDLTSAYWFVPYSRVTVTVPPDAPAGSLTRLVEFEGPLDDSNAPASPGPNVVPTELVALTRRRPTVHFTRLLPDAGWLTPAVPDEATTPIGDYYSIQNQFPPCFALEDNALPPDTPPARVAQVRQLRGYLLVFEQLLANYLAQLEHTVDYFSSRAQQRTTFVQPLATVPDVLPLLDGYPFDNNSLSRVEQAKQAELFWADPINPYLTGLRNAAENEEEFLSRRNGVLDQLLARFNESFPATPDEATFETIRNKEDLLREYRRLGYQRAQAADPTRAVTPSSRRPRSGLEEKIQILLRRDTQPNPPALDDLSVQVREQQPADFYFVLEPIRFLPVPAAAAAGESISFPVSAFQPALYHVFLNWTYQPLNSAFTAYVENIVSENMPAHLTPYFVWLETNLLPPVDAQAFVYLFRAWAEAGYPKLQLATPSAMPSEGTLAVLANTPAANLFQWLLHHRPRALVQPPGGSSLAGAGRPPHGSLAERRGGAVRSAVADKGAVSPSKRPTAPWPPSTATSAPPSSAPTPLQPPSPSPEPPAAEPPPPPLP